MNKKYEIILVFILLVGTVFLIACQSKSEVGGKVDRNVVSGDRIYVGSISCNCGDNKKCEGKLESWDGGMIIADCSCCTPASTTKN